MRVFAHLDANSVFAVSLTNHALLARVNGLFGVATPAPRVLSTRRQSAKPQQSSPQSPKPRTLQAKGRSQSAVTQSDKERAQVRATERTRAAKVWID